MHDKFLLDRKEISCTLINIITIKMLFIYPRAMVINSGNSAWLQCLYVSLIAVLLYFLTSKLYERIGNIGIIQASEKIGGKALKIIIGTLITVILILNISVNFRLLPESVKTVLLPLTPLKLLAIVFLAVTSIGAYLGIYSICRIHALFLPIAFIALAIFFAFIIPYADLNNLFPIFGLGTDNIFVDGLSSLSIFSDILVLFILMPYCKNYSIAKKSGKNAIIISSVISFLIVLLYNLVYSYPASTEFIFPAYQMTRLVRIGDFFQRMEAFFEFIWSILMLLYSSIYLFVICEVWQKSFGLKYYKELIMPFILIIGGVAFCPATLMDSFKISTIISDISPFIAFLIPIAVAVIYRIKFKDKFKEKLYEE